MSYEGYTQYLCRRRHYNEFDVYYDQKHCEYCGESFIWANSVDQTNGSYCDAQGEESCEGCEYCENGRIDGCVDLETLYPEEVVNGKFHPAVFKVPSNKGRRLLK